MSEKSITKLQDELAAVKGRAVSTKRKADEKGKVMQRDATALVAAYGYGAFKKDRRTNNQTMPTLFGLDPELAATGVLYVIGMALDGEAAEAAHDAALGIGCGYAMAKAST